MSQFQNKSVVITGGCSGIGYEVAKHMLRQGVKVSAKNVVDKCYGLLVDK